MATALATSSVDKGIQWPAPPPIRGVRMGGVDNGWETVSPETTCDHERVLTVIKLPFPPSHLGWIELAIVFKHVSNCSTPQQGMTNPLEKHNMGAEHSRMSVTARRTKCLQCHSHLNTLPLAAIACRPSTLVSTLIGDFYCPHHTLPVVFDIRCLNDYCPCYRSSSRAG